MGRTTIRYCSAATTTTTTTMKSIVMILCLGVAAANPQGFGGLGIGGTSPQQAALGGVGVGGPSGFGAFSQQNFLLQQGACGEPGLGGMQGPGCTADQQTRGCPAPNVNRWETVCPGGLKRTCFGRGLNNPCAGYILPQSVQCLARAAQQASTAEDQFRVRVDFDGQAYITDTFGTAIEDIEIPETGFGIAAQQANQAKAFKYEGLVKHGENFCLLSRRR